MNQPILEVANLRIEFPNIYQVESTVAVNGISFEVFPGQVLGLVGESGSGKSVTSLAIMGLVPTPGKVTQGEIFFRSEKSGSNQEMVTATNLLDANNREKLRQYRGGEIATIFQEPMSSLNPVYNIGFQITEAIQLHQPSVTKEQAKQQAIALLQQVQLLPSDEQLEEDAADKISNANSKDRKEYVKQQKDALLKRYPHQLSGGQLQRVMIAMAISCDPTLLIADEPTTALDVTVQAEILRLLRDLCKSEEHRNMSMIFVSHDLGVINEIADDVAVMYRGQIVERGTKNQILFHPEQPYTKALLACRPRLNILPKTLPTVADYLESATNGNGNQPIAPTEQNPEVKYISLKEQQARLNELSKAETLLTVENLTVQYPKRAVWGRSKEYFKAVDDISFEVKRGETLGLVGESGCGKSTLARAILRLIPIHKGNIDFAGEEISQLPLGSRRLRTLRRRMQVIFQNPFNSLNPRLTIGKAIMEPMLIHKTKGTAREAKQEVKRLLARVELQPDWFDRYPHELSGGQRQRVCIARALTLHPEFIICDESVSALDVSVQAGVLNLLKELQQDFNLTYIFISHDLSVVRFMSDRIMVMNKGKKEEPISSADNIINRPQSPYTQKLIASIPEYPEDYELS